SRSMYSLRKASSLVASCWSRSCTSSRRPLRSAAISVSAVAVGDAAAATSSDSTSPRPRTHTDNPGALCHEIRSCPQPGESKDGVRHADTCLGPHGRLALTPTLPDTNYYALLAVDPSADAVAIRKAWVNEQRLWG